MFEGVYSGKRVLVTGHTGFKGSWLVYWLQQLGAEVCGYSLEAPTDPSHWDLLQLDCRSEAADIRDAERLQSAFSSFRPEIVFHLAAQSLLRRSYRFPDETFEVNVMGTVRVMEACRTCESVRAAVIVTSDKCYENREWIWGYREQDAMGGYDPYSASKGCAELIASAYRRAFFNSGADSQACQTLVASCRAGNVIGVGDWAEDRLIPDVMRAASRGEIVGIRNPSAIRPWQHVLEPLSGYLLVGKRLMEGDGSVSGAWNFGPERDGTCHVEEVVKIIAELWPQAAYRLENTPGPHEARFLKLDISKAVHGLNWRPVWTLRTSLEHTVKWYRAFYEKSSVRTGEDLAEFEADARIHGSLWAI